MKIDYTLREDDYLKYQLYNVAHSKQVRKRRQRSQILLPVAYLLMGASFLLLDNQIAAAIFGVVAVIWFFLIPIYIRKRYVKIYKKFNAENYAENFNQPLSIETKSDKLHLTSPKAESEIKYNAISEIIDLGTHYLIKFTMGSVSILPVNREVSKSVCDDLIGDIAAKSGKSVYDKTDWEWK
ncbi:MAG: hypothetical protein CVU11_11165 [Bacteroidetes bacterium HGW-Bacteroidetes-6]|jgi:hypothetical protein|nr:MAG: hypothetical protein CVU11_11165 [Bacteroidetes bacterium HGW-Bacteroidetes-6]